MYKLVQKARMWQTFNIQEKFKKKEKDFFFKYKNSFSISSVKSPISDETEQK